MNKPIPHEKLAKLAADMIESGEEIAKIKEHLPFITSGEVRICIKERRAMTSKEGGALQCEINVSVWLDGKQLETPEHMTAKEYLKQGPIVAILLELASTLAAGESACIATIAEHVGDTAERARLTVENDRLRSHLSAITLAMQDTQGAA